MHLLNSIAAATLLLTGTDSLVAQAQETAGNDTLISQIGVLDGNPDYVLGVIGDMAVDQDGNIYILDRHSFDLRWFGPDGELRGRTGREGGGPGEFRIPAGLAVGSDRTIMVVDTWHRRISKFQASDGGLAYVGAIKTPVAGLSICVIGERIYLLATNESRLIHEVDSSGNLVRSFGSLVKVHDDKLASHAENLKDSYNRGRLYCSQNPALVVLLHAELPWVRAFTPDGEHLWTTTLENYHRRRRKLVMDGQALQLMPDPESGTAHSGSGIARIDANHIAITLHEGSLADPKVGLEARVLRLSDGREVRAMPAPSILRFIQAGRVYGYENLPYPRILIYSRDILKN